jgi:hypothetical protein
MLMTLRILNLGAGVQSTTVYLMAASGEIPSYDYAVFADTGEEPRPVYEHLEWLKRVGGPPIITCSSGKLGDDIVMGRNGTGGRFVTIPAFLEEDGRVGIGRRQCTREYKIDAVDRVIRRELLGLKPRQRVRAGVQVVQAYGISADEAGRSVRIRRRMEKHSRWLAPEFPLLDRGMTRADCVRWLAAYGVPHEVPKSACVFCPYRNNVSWVWLQQHDPDGWRRAVEIDEALRSGAVTVRGMRAKLYLHRSAKPLREVDFSSAADAGKQLEFHTECAGMCGV